MTVHSFQQISSISNLKDSILFVVLVILRLSKVQMQLLEGKNVFSSSLFVGLPFLEYVFHFVVTVLKVSVVSVKDFLEAVV